MTAVSNPCGKSPCVYPWGSVGRLQLDESVWWRFSSFSIARLLHAFPSLVSLKFGSAKDMFTNAHGIPRDVSITGVPAYPRLKPINIVVEYRTSGRPQHVANIVRSLIKMDYPLKITEIMTPIYLSRDVTDTVVVIATNELIKQAGPSLKYLDFSLKLRVVPTPSCSDRGGFRSDPYRLPNFLERTYLLSSPPPYPKAFWICACKSLSHVTSTCVSSVDICINWFSWDDRGELNNVFTQLDAVLSIPVFDSLVHVTIRVRFDEPDLSLQEIEMVEWAYWTKACLLSLDKRGILGIEVCEERLTPHVRLGLVWDRGIKDWKHYDSKVGKNGNVKIIEIPAFEGGAPSEAIAAHTAWKRSDQGHRRSILTEEMAAQRHGYILLN